MDIYVGNLAYATTDDTLRAAFEAFGEVTSAEVKKDRMTGRSKGFGFVEMPNAEEANAAVVALNESELDGRNIRVNESNPQPRGERPPRRGGFGGGRRSNFGERRGGFGDCPRREGGFSRGPRREGGGRRGGFGDRPRRDRGDTPRESTW